MTRKMLSEQQRIFKERKHIKHYYGYWRYWKKRVCACVIDYLIRVELTYAINQPNLFTFIAFTRRWRERMCTTKVVFRPNLRTNKQLLSPDLNSQPIHKTFFIIEILTFRIVDNKMLCWVGTRGWKRKTPILFSVQSYDFCMVICIAYFHAENLDYCVYYFLKTSALIVVRHSWFFLNILKFIPNICHKNTWS